jgi:hypothetical protein
VQCYTFDTNVYNYLGDPHRDSIVTRGGSLTNLDNAPVPIYKRGLYFNGVDMYAEIHGLTIHHTCTLTMWLRAANEGVLFSIN